MEIFKKIYNLVKASHYTMQIVNITNPAHCIVSTSCVIQTAFVSHLHIAP